ncbi:MAG: chromate reductase [Cognaticolwellia sp.]|jgi:chromate reductase
MKKILAFGASNSKNSINKKLALFATTQIEDVEITFLDLNDFEMPIYGIDKENENGIPKLAHDIKNHIRNADGILISFAEHNGTYTTAFKNILDWLSRIERSVFLEKPMFLLATSPGGRGASGALGQVSSSFPFMGGKIAATFSLPSFGQHFSEEKGIINEELLNDFQGKLREFVKAVEVNLAVEA